MSGLMNKLVKVPSVVPQSCSAATTGDYVSLKNVEKCTVLVALGAINTSVTVQLRQALDVSGTGVKALKFDHVYRTGGDIAITGVSGTFAVGETVTGGTSSATGVIYQVFSGSLVLYTISGTFQSGETLTGGTSSATATSTSAITNFGRKCRVEMTAANTIALTNGSEDYEIDVYPDSLDMANLFDCITADVSAVAGGAGLVSISYLLKPLYVEDATISPLVD